MVDSAVRRLRTLARRGLLNPGPPDQVARQLAALRRWGFGLAGELRSAAARDPDRTAVVEERGSLTYARPGRSAPNGWPPALRGGSACGPATGSACCAATTRGMVEGMVAASLLGADAVLVNTGLSPAHSWPRSPSEQRAAAGHPRRRSSPSTSPTLPRSIRPDSASPLWTDCVARGAGIRGPPARSRTAARSCSPRAPPARRRAPAGPRRTGSPRWPAIISRIPLHAGDPHAHRRARSSTPGAWRRCRSGSRCAATMVLRRRFEPADALDADPGTRVHGAVRGTGDAATPAGDRPGRYRLPLTVVAVSGSALPGGLATRFMDAYGDVLYNLYGSTEASWASIATPEELRRRAEHGRPAAARYPGGDPVPGGSTVADRCRPAGSSSATTCCSRGTRTARPGAAARRAAGHRRRRAPRRGRTALSSTVARTT